MNESILQHLSQYHPDVGVYYTGQGLKTCLFFFFFCLESYIICLYGKEGEKELWKWGTNHILFSPFRLASSHFSSRFSLIGILKTMDI